jgi:hypothetical protein
MSIIIQVCYLSMFYDYLHFESYRIQPCYVEVEQTAIFRYLQCTTLDYTNDDYLPSKLSNDNDYLEI